ncbi:MAG TPA: SDR family oxidoreductase [Desulfobacterales bacterium]|nr:SDR family oxidoreductase [Desulfobacterales bacterium]
MPKLNEIGEWKNPGKVFITSASSGIGASYAKAFAENGYDLVLLARRKDRLQALAKQLESGGSIDCEIISADLAEQEEIKKVTNHIRQIDNLDILINNAGFATIGYFADIPIEKSMRMFHTHMTATVQFTHAALQVMLKRERGAIINVSSMGAFMLTPGNVLYDATKSFLATFSENLWLEVRDKGIKVQALCPGFTRTEFHEVGDFKNFDKSVIPDSLWMMPDEVVRLSLKALENSRDVVFIPGWKKRLVKWIIQHSSIIREILQRRFKEKDLPTNE